MEILIVGVVLVALMVFVSTKIKKSAAQAFERETIDTEDFRITKPEGFISPINENSRFAFEAYTKDSGKNDAEEFRQAQARLMVITDSDFETVCENVKKSVGRVLSENFLENAAVNQKHCFIESEEIKNNVKIISFWKIIKSIQKQKIYELQVSVLENYREEFQDRINEMLESFAVK
ncbi:MAG: hypothetical protein LC768_06435 [Acidobacteria bacterium]|nr:hypothetical protein [Acidobacteriota bacterium]MCA1637961.1 hypothetical protein [Acidobacteriota bacterium]